MSVDEDTELRDMVVEQLDANGVLGKLKAMLRAHVFLTLENQESAKKLNNDRLRKSIATSEGKMMAAIVIEYLRFFDLEFTLMTLKPEAGLDDSVVNLGREEISRQLDIVDSELTSGQPLLGHLVRKSSDDDSTAGGDKSWGRRSNEFADLTQKHIDDAKRKFEEYDKDGSGTIEKGELRMLFVDMFPDVNKNMLERYVNDQYSFADRDFSGGIDFKEFLNLYRSFFVLCKSSVSHDVGDLLLSPKQLSPMSKIPIKMPDVKRPAEKSAESPKLELFGNGNKSGSAGDNWWDSKKSSEASGDHSKGSSDGNNRQASSLVDSSLDNKENVFVDDKSRTKEASKIPVFGNGHSGDKGRTPSSGVKLSFGLATSGSSSGSSSSGGSTSPTSPGTNLAQSPGALASVGQQPGLSMAPAPVAPASAVETVASSPAVPATVAQKQSMSSLADLPRPAGALGGLTASLSAASPVGTVSKGDAAAANTGKDPSKDLKAIDQRLAELGFGEDEYEEDFQSSANPSESTTTEKVEDEIEEEIVQDIDDILNTGRSLDATTDRTVSPVHDMDGADYWEEAELIK